MYFFKEINISLKTIGALNWPKVKLNMFPNIYIFKNSVCCSLRITEKKIGMHPKNSGFTWLKSETENK